MQLNIDALNIHIHLHKEPVLGAALVKAALAEKDQQAEQPAEALAETPECEAKCSVTSIELPPAVAALLAGALAGELQAREGQKAD